ncbi:lipopolysaccharide biosynthesis protein [Agaribacterium sp. ZY112]|uniref:lipopolysaccharide biosynthesis protein n=1 Tax=Agaribacterium sp. ZY112 TaxID=3233574 RepID=UPI003523C4DE
MRANKTLLRSLLYAGSTVYMKGISLFMVPLVVSYLQPEQYGRLEYIGSFAILLSVIVAYGLEDTLYRYACSSASKLRAKTMASRIFGLVILISLIFFALFSLLIPFYAEFINISPYLCLLLILSLSFEGLIAVPLGWMRINDRFISYCSLNIGRATLQALLTLYLLSRGHGLAGVFEASCLTTVLTGMICLFIQKKDTGCTLSLRHSYVFIKYASPIVAGGLLAFCLNGFDRWMIAETASLTDLAIYAVTCKFALALTIAMQPYGMWWSPTRFSLLDTSNKHQKATKFALLGIYQVLLFSIGIASLAPLLIIYLFDSEFIACISMLTPLLAAYAIKESAEFLNIGCYTTHSTTSQMKVMFISAVAGVLAMFVLAPMFSLIGIILSLLIAQTTRTVLLYIYSQRQVNLDIAYGRMILLLVSSYVGIYVANQVFISELTTNIHEDKLSLIIKTCLVTIFLAATASIVFLVLFYKQLGICISHRSSENEYAHMLIFHFSSIKLIERVKKRTNKYKRGLA